MCFLIGGLALVILFPLGLLVSAVLGVTALGAISVLAIPAAIVGCIGLIPCLGLLSVGTIGAGTVGIGAVLLSIIIGILGVLLLPILACLSMFMAPILLSCGGLGFTAGFLGMIAYYVVTLTRNFLGLDPSVNYILPEDSFEIYNQTNNMNNMSMSTLGTYGTMGTFGTFGKLGFPSSLYFKDFPLELRHEDEVQKQEDILIASTSCSATIETSYMDLFDKNEEKISKIFQDSVNEILSDFFMTSSSSSSSSSSKENVTNSFNDFTTAITSVSSHHMNTTTTTTTPSSSSSSLSSMFDVYFTISKQFSCDEKNFNYTHNNTTEDHEALCAEFALSKANEFVQETNKILERATINGNLTTLLMENGNNNIDFIEREPNVTSMQCNATTSNTEEEEEIDNR